MIRESEGSLYDIVSIKTKRPEGLEKYDRVKNPWRAGKSKKEEVEA